MDKSGGISLLIRGRYDVGQLMQTLANTVIFAFLKDEPHNDQDSDYR